MVFAGGAVAGLATLAAGNEPEYPSIDEFLPGPILFAGTPFAINRLILVRLIATLILVTVLCVTAKRAKVIPGRWQSTVEFGLDFVRNSIVYEVMGEERGKRYVTLITTIFFSIFFFNFCEVIPGLDIAATATIAMPLMFAIWSLISYWSAGIRTRGLGGFLKAELFPAGIPWPIYILLAPINLLEITIVRPFSLTIRLFANMVSGYLLLGLCFAATQFFVLDAVNKALMPLGILTLGCALMMTLFEILVAGLQAFIFAVLTTAYISMSMPDTVSAEAPEKANAIAAAVEADPVLATATAAAATA